MQKVFIYFLLISLACQYINCQRICPNGEILVNERCQKCYHAQQLSNLSFCYQACPENTIIDEIEKKCLFKQEDCKQVISSDGKFCQKYCDQYEFIKPNNQTRIKKCQLGCSEFQYEQYFETICDDKCPGDYRTDWKNKKCIKNSENCPIGISSDNKTCVESCEENEYIFKENGKHFFTCRSSCQINFFYYEQNGKKYCQKDCPDNMIQDLQKLKCIENISEIEIASQDETYCLKSCKSCNASNREVVVSKKCQACTDYYWVSEIKCRKTCSKHQITDKKKKLCYSRKEDCKGLISSNGTECVRRCNSQIREAPVKSKFQFHPSQCQVCQNYFTYGKNKAKNSCKSKCDDNQITIIPLKTCTKDVADCSSYTLSEDKKSCS